MNHEFPSFSSSTIESIRKAGIGRRGGVQVRGGRLPPVQIHNVLSKKKIIAPKIPQKRTEIKKEKLNRNAFEELPFRDEANFQPNFSRGSRGRGRGAKVYIQTEGTLFGDGISASKVKKERDHSGYERASVPRYKSSIKLEEKVNPEEIDSILESYDYPEDESDTERDLRPVKYPCVKDKQEVKPWVNVKQKVKQETEEILNHDIAQNLSVEDVKPFIKVEPIDDYEIPNKGKSLVSEFFTPIEAVSFDVENDLIADLKKLKKEEGIMLLIQFPSCFPFQIESDETEMSGGKKKPPSSSNEKAKEKNQEEEVRKNAKIRDIPEGYVGKLQFLKSGKMRLVMGSTYFYLENGSNQELTADVVSIPVQGTEGDIIVLGEIERKMLFRPYFSGISN